jgi:ArsR family transcriptional regulator, arsenate/arsenite/antimonite-responsive transcriptional repressor
MLAFASIAVNIWSMECCTSDAAPLGESEAEALAVRWRALGDPSRLRILSLIAASGEMCGCDLTEPVSLSQPTVSHHLKVLTEAGFVIREQRGKWAWYSVAPEAVEEVAAALGNRITAGAV